MYIDCDGRKYNGRVFGRGFDSRQLHYIYQGGLAFYKASLTICLAYAFNISISCKNESQSSIKVSLSL